MAPAPAPSTAPAGALPNTLEVERLYTVACEKVEQQLCLKKMEPVEPQKPAPPAPTPAPPFFKEIRPLVWLISLWYRANFIWKYVLHVRCMCTSSHARWIEIATTHIAWEATHGPHTSLWVYTGAEPAWGHGELQPLYPHVIHWSPYKSF